MKLWPVLIVLALLAAVFVVIPIWRNRRTVSATSSSGGKRGSGLWLSLGLTGLIFCIALATYAVVGRPDLLALNEPNPTPESPKGSAPPAASMASMIDQLRAKVSQNPKDADAWQTLGWAYMHIRQPADAVEAYKHAVALAPGDTSYRSALVEATIQSGDGKISAQALADLRAIATKDPADPRTRFYLALYKDQQGDHKGAIADWIVLVKSAPPGAAWASEVRQVVEKVAQEEHIDISGKLPPQAGQGTAMPPPGMPGPSAEQMAAAQQMSEGDRNTMIRGMVDRLAGELKQNPKNADGWQRLMRARMVLGQKGEAEATYRDAKRTFSSEPAQLATIDETARSLGVAGQ